MQVVIAADANDPPNSDVYNGSVQLYPLDSRWYIGFPSFLLRDKGISDGRLEVQFVGSTDGIHWNRYDRTPYARPGLVGSGDENMVFMSTGMIIRGDEIWQYSAGFHTRHGDVEGRKENGDGAIYRYVQRLDGFVSMDFGPKGGRCVSEPVTVEGAQLAVNVDTAAMGELKVAHARCRRQATAGIRVRTVPAAPTQLHPCEGKLAGTDEPRLVARQVGSSRVRRIEGEALQLLLRGIIYDLLQNSGPG